MRVEFRPVVSEKSIRLVESGWYVFKTVGDFNRIEFGKKISDHFSLKVRSVNRVRSQSGGKAIRRGKVTGTSKVFVKWAVKFVDGQDLSKVSNLY